MVALFIDENTQVNGHLDPPTEATTADADTLPRRSERPGDSHVEVTRRRRRGFVVALLLVVGVLLFVGAFAAVAMLGVRTDLQDGRQALQDARRALTSGDVDGAATSFQEARDAFADGERRTRGVAARAGSWLPFLGNNVDVGAGLARAGVDVADAGALLTEAIASLPEGLGSLAPSDGRIPLEDVSRLAEPVAAAADRAREAATEVESTPESFLVAPVAEARWDAIDEVADAAQTLTAAERLIANVPLFAGAEEPKRYLVASENPAELRGTGGLWGAYAVLTLDEGEPSFSRVRSIQELPDVDPDEIPAPSADYERNYAEFGGAGSWHNLNMTPDFPTAARAALGAFEAATGDRFDGMIAADPFALELMLGVTGPARIPGTDVELSADDVVAFTTNEAYSIFDQTVVRKEVLGTVAIDVLERFLGLEGKGLERIRALTQAASEGHLKLYTSDDTFEDALASAGVDGAHAMPDGGDLLSVNLNNASGSKIDFYMTREIDHRVVLGGRGEAVSTTTVTLGNEAPRRGQPRYVIGPVRRDGFVAGENRSLPRISCHAPCTLVDARADDRPIALATGSEGGVPWFRDFPTIPSGEDRTLEVTTRTEDVWEGNASGGVYRLTVLGQTTIRPTELSITIEAPEGTEIVWTNEDMTVDGAVATWEGEEPARLELEVRFRAPLPLRWWRNVLRPFGGL